MIYEGFSSGIVGLVAGLMFYPVKLGALLIIQYTTTALLASAFVHQYVSYSDSEMVKGLEFYIGAAAALSSIFIAKGFIVILQRFSIAPLKTLRDVKDLKK